MPQTTVAIHSHNKLTTREYNGNKMCAIQCKPRFFVSSTFARSFKIFKRDVSTEHEKKIHKNYNNNDKKI